MLDEYDEDEDDVDYVDRCNDNDGDWGDSSVWQIRFSVPNTNTNIFGLTFFGEYEYKYIKFIFRQIQIWL